MGRKTAFRNDETPQIAIATASPAVSSGVDHQSHYNLHPSGVECQEIVRHFNFNRGNAIKYIWRAGLKRTGEHWSDDEIRDLEKARWYLDDEIRLLRRVRVGGSG